MVTRRSKSISPYAREVLKELERKPPELQKMGTPLDAIQLQVVTALQLAAVQVGLPLDLNKLASRARSPNLSGADPLGSLQRAFARLEQLRVSLEALRGGSSASQCERLGLEAIGLLGATRTVSEQMGTHLAAAWRLVEEERQKLSKPVDARLHGPIFARGAGDTHAVDPSDVFQGGVGDCYLLAVLAAVARTDPRVIERMIKANSDGTYTVHFAGLGKRITVPGEFPYNRWGQHPVNARQGDMGELWVMLIESAWKELGGGWSAIHGGQPEEAFKAIHASRPENYNLTLQPKSAREIERLLREADESGRPVSLWTKSYGEYSESQRRPFSDLNLVYKHAYTFMGMSGSRADLRNPHGNKHPRRPLSGADIKELFGGFAVGQF